MMMTISPTRTLIIWFTVVLSLSRSPLLYSNYVPM